MMASTNILALTLLFGMASADLRLPTYYMNNMVFQADQDQTMLFGFTTEPDLPVLVTVTCDGPLEEKPTTLEALPSGFKANLRCTKISNKSPKSQPGSVNNLILKLTYGNFFQALKADEFVWEVIYPEIRSNGDKCDINIEQGESLRQLYNVNFGDVWICSGQGLIGS